MDLDEIIQEVIDKTELNERDEIRKQLNEIPQSQVEGINSAIIKQGPDYRLTKFEYARGDVEMILHMKNRHTNKKQSVTLTTDVLE